MQVKVSTLRTLKMDAMKADRLHRTKRQQKRKNYVKYLLKIIHLNDDCLERIFFQLDLIELAKVADANTRLAAVATDVFAQKYQQQEIQIRSCQDTKLCGNKEELNYGRMPFEEVRMILEHFGKHIIKLDIDFGPFSSSHRAQRIVDKVSEFCSSTLLELKLGMLRDGMRFRQPFIKLEKLVFYQSFFRFHEPIKEISTSFPNIRCIELQNIRYAFKSIRLEQRLPTLQHIGYYTHPYVQFSAEDLQSIHRIAQLNPQLRSLGTYLGAIEMSKIGPESMSMEPMPSIDTIEAVCSYPMANGPFHFANIKHLKLNGSETLDRGWFEIGNQIEQLDLLACPIDENIANFIVSCRNLKKLKIVTNEDFDMEHVKHIAKNLPSLNEVHFSVYKHNKELKHSTALTAVVEFMQHCKQLARASAAHDIDDGKQCRSRYKHSTYIKSKPIIKLYRDTIDRSVPQSSQWRINHQLKPVELIKGFEGYHRYLFFQAKFEKRRQSNA
ncbi:uncharacterized protein LOC129580397 [Sitodiplosis mosellana]|uniref:uncharacterized protein LOC129580397 n=1 Tax=Sitodiplosis mosellana TaxID=263140 RepID=UPI002443B7A2|nr:uncharacterized protein LOC129580397 [Sitodiplosis mosellana]